MEDYKNAYDSPILLSKPSKIENEGDINGNIIEILLKTDPTNSEIDFVIDYVQKEDYCEILKTFFEKDWKHNIINFIKNITIISNSYISESLYILLPIAIVLKNNISVLLFLKNLLIYNINLISPSECLYISLDLIDYTHDFMLFDKLISFYFCIDDIFIIESFINQMLSKYDFFQQ